MKSQKTICQQLAWEPNPQNIPDGRSPVKEGATLPNSETEDVGGFSLCPTYSAKQLRRIERFRIRETKYGHANPKKLKFGGRLQWR